MKIAHVGPPLARTGGSAGYLLQLQLAMRGSVHGHDVTFPEEAVPGRRPVAPSVARRLWTRARRVFTGQPFYRPTAAARRKRGGPIDESIARAFGELNAAAGMSVRRAIERPADVIVAHDVSVADAALKCARPGQQVWLTLHSPMPTALYLAWNWGVPEADWREVMTYPDVAHWTAWEVDVCRRVARVILPCAEARGELVRCHRGYAPVLRHADIVLTGASRPASAAHAPPQERAASRARWRLPIDQRVGLFLGSAQAYRGYDALLGGLSLLADATAIPGTIAVAGPDPRSMPTHDRTRLLGRVEDVGELLRACDFVVNANRFSLFDLSLIEAAEAGRALVLHDTGGNRAFRDLGAGCVMIPDLQPRSVAHAIEEAFTMPDIALAELGRRSLACYNEYLTPARFAERHIALYDSAVERARSEIEPSVGRYPVPSR